MITSLQTVIRTKFTTSAFYLCVLLLLISCASAPVQEMSDARQAIQAAREASVHSTPHPDLRQAESLLKEAELALENGDYKIARSRANQAREAALQAQKALNEASTDGQ